MQAQQFTSASLAVKSIWKSQGVRGMYAGYFAFLLRDLPFDAIEFWAYDTTKRLYQQALPVQRDLHPWEAGAAGAVAGALTGAHHVAFPSYRCEIHTYMNTIPRCLIH